MTAAEAIDFEYVTHPVLGHDITFVLNRNNTDWYTQNMRVKPFPNPVHRHLLKMRDLAGGASGLKYADIGANIGVTCLFAARHGIATLAVEAGPLNYALLSEAIAVNGLSPLCRPCLAAAADRRGLVRFDDRSAWGKIDPEAPGATTLPADTLAGILTQQGFADAACIKIDIEGSELAALTGFEAIAGRPDAPDLIVESNGVECLRAGYSAQALWARLGDLGYRVFHIFGPRLSPAGSAAVPQGRVVMDVLATRKTDAVLTGDYGYKIVPFTATEVGDFLDKIPVTGEHAARIAAFVSEQRRLLAAAQ